MRQKSEYPSDVVAEGGEVLVDGPAGVTISLAPAAAATTGDRLIACADTAFRQNNEEPERTQERGDDASGN